MIHLLETSYTLLHPAEKNDEEAFIWITKIPHQFFNIVMGPKSLNNLISKDIPHSVLVNKKDTILAEELKSKNYQCMMTATLMHWKVQPIQEEKYRIEVAEMKTFESITCETYQIEEKIAHAFTVLLEKTKAENYVVYQNEKPVGTGTLVSNDKIGGIYNIATLSEYQKKGCGNAMMRHLMNRAQELDLKVVVLLSSAAGFKLYSDLGFIADLDFDFYC